MRSLRRRLNALTDSSGIIADKVLAALDVLIETGVAPDTAHGAKALDVWERSAEFHEESKNIAVIP